MRMNLNMGIARAHELATQLVGIQLAAANLLALFLSMISVVAGCVTYAILNKPGAWPFWIVAGVIGSILALLIEGMTLGALIRIRLANTQIRKIVQTLEKEREETIGKKEGRFKFWRRKQDATRAYRKSRRSSIPLAIIGSGASATAGGLFYHQLLASIGTYESIGVSVLFALMVAGTFVSSELYKDMQEEAVREGFKGGSLSEEALREEAYRQTNQAVADEVTAYLSSQDAKDIIKQTAEQVLHDVVSELRKRSAERVGHVTVTPAGDTTQQQLVALIPQSVGRDTTARSAGSTTAQLAGNTTVTTRHDSPDIEPVMQQLVSNPVRHDSPLGGSDTTGVTQQRTGNSIRRDSLVDQGDTTISQHLNITRQVTRSLGMIEQAMLDALQKAPEKEQNELRALASAQPLAEFTRTLQGRYPQYASYITETRVAHVMEVFQATAEVAQVERQHDNQSTTSIRATDDTATKTESDKATRQEHDTDQRHDSQHEPRHDAGNIRFLRKATEASTTAEQATRTTTTTGSDITAARILAYQAEHPDAKQADVAQAFGVTVRTIQRKLASNRSEESAG